MIDLREKDRKSVCDLASQIFPYGTVLWAHGSRVKGTNYDASDLDIVVHFPDGQDENDSFAQLAAFNEALRDSNIPIIVQALSWSAIPESFKTNIKSCYQELCLV
ncbi:nucleotidyltransferase domain-containing protein [Endozoicomonas sp. 8E]|uniref:nucleotidyltransferase domain-containing protein n=1 Tax=Endozoicomonas sp. 8E TaxID=3035692 RepID=UPI0029394A3F|nr:nucleotidyltransferase domain-containing protein [Endozoicomonas sp. 8E]WOG29976.1 nucleotidyltransferase domain-containing protein [Endozoicomonas sp. 8E]